MTGDLKQQLKKMLEEAGISNLQPMLDNFEDLSRIVLSGSSGPISGLPAPPVGFEFDKPDVYAQFRRNIKSILEYKDGFTGLLLLFGEVDPVWSYYLGQILAEDDNEIKKAIGARLNTTWTNQRINIVIYSILDSLKTKYRVEFVAEYFRNLKQYQSLNLLGFYLTLRLFGPEDKEASEPLNEVLSMVEKGSFNFPDKNGRKELVKAIKETLNRIGAEGKSKSLKFWN